MGDSAETHVPSQLRRVSRASLPPHAGAASSPLQSTQPPSLPPPLSHLVHVGAFNELDDQSLHMLSLHSSAYANLAMQQADVLIALGAQFDDHTTGKVDSQ